MEGNHRSLKIFLAVFAGSLIGGLVCRHIGFTFWWIGLLIGGLIGYLAYEPLAVLKAIPVAWHFACRLMGLSGRFLRENRGIILIIFLAGQLAWFWLIVPLVLLANATSKLLSTWPIGSTYCFIMAIGFYGMLGKGRNKPEVHRNYKLFLTHFNPVSLVFYTYPVYMYRLTRDIIKGCWHYRRAPLVAGRFLSLFFWKLFLIIHSQERLLCGIDAAIGAALVYFLHYSPLIGAGLGGLFGVMNFEILSKRILKVVPAKAHL